MSATPSGPAGERLTDILFRRFRRTRDPRAGEAIVQRFLPLARKLARRYHGGGEPLEDLVQVANLGLVKAVQRYDDTGGVSLSRYAVPTITRRTWMPADEVQARPDAARAQRDFWNVALVTRCLPTRPVRRARSQWTRAPVVSAWTDSRAGSSHARMSVAILDIDGTLVDTTRRFRLFTVR